MTNREDLDRYLVDDTATLAQVMRKIDQAESRVVFVQCEGRVLGAISDGDVRRAVLAGSPLTVLASTIMKADFVRAHVADGPVALHHLFGHGVSAVPLVDADGRLVDMLFEHTRTLIPLAQPEITPREVQLVNECLKTGWISSAGRFIQEFEDLFTAYTQVTSSVAVSSGTTALVLALKALDIGAGDEVIVPDLTFGATANAVVQAGATPVFADVDARTWCLDPESVVAALSPRTRVILPVHLYGRSADLGALSAIAQEHGLLVVEDCAEALGTEDAVGHVGAHSDAAAFSFFANKTVTTGEGGMACFRSAKVAERAKSIRSHGFSTQRRYWHDEWGTNFRMTNLQASIGVAQMERVETTVARKLAIGREYHRLLAPLIELGLDLPDSPSAGVHSYWLYTVLLPAAANPDVVAERMMAMGVECRRVFYPLHAQPAFARYTRPSDVFPRSESVSARGLSLPSWPGLSIADLETVVSSLRAVLTAVE